MDEIFAWNTSILIISDIFAIINALLLVKWNRPVKQMQIIGVAAAAVLTVVTILLASFNIRIYEHWPVITFCLASVGILCARYYDSRTVFSFATVFALCISASTLFISTSGPIDNDIYKLVYFLIIHLVYTSCVYFLIRDPFFEISQLFKKGWLISCLIPISLFLTLLLLNIYPVSLARNPTAMPAAAAVSASSLLIYLLMAILAQQILKKKEDMLNLEIVVAQAKSAETQLYEASLREKDSSILRHDIRHFVNIIANCIQNNLYDEALESANALLSHSAMSDPDAKYCKNVSINALLGSFAQRARAQDIDFVVAAALDEKLCIDVVELAVVLSNLLENALHACAKIDSQKERSIHIKLSMAGEQLFISITNTNENPIEFNPQTGLPRPVDTSNDHGIGMLSVERFLKKFNAHSDCKQENNSFQIRIVASPRVPSIERTRTRQSLDSSVFRINFVISMLILAGFLMNGVSTYLNFNKLFKMDVEAVSQLASENIYSNISNLMDRPINVSLAMANDTLLRDLMLVEGEDNSNSDVAKRIQSYLSAFQKKYEFDSVFLVSTKTNSYYHFQNGIDRHLEPKNDEDIWYYKFLNEDTDCSLNVDNDQAQSDHITIFVNCKLKDLNGETLAVIGVGLKTPYIQQLLLENEKKYNLNAYIINENGKIMLSSSYTEFENVNLFSQPIFEKMKISLPKDEFSTENKWYSDGNVDGYIITKYIPDLNWYLVVEKDTAELQHAMLKQFLWGIVFMVIVLVIIIILTTYILTKFHSLLLVKAEKDQLTGLRNRTGYEQELKQYSERLSKLSNFGIGVFDLNNLKEINDTFGHQTGDLYLKTFSSLLCLTFSHCPAFRIGGDEFLIIFLNISEEEVIAKWHSLELALDQAIKGNTPRISSAFGYAFYDENSLNAVDKIFREADRQMYDNKKMFKDSQS